MGIIAVSAGAVGAVIAFKICLAGCCRYVGAPEPHWVVPLFGCLLRCTGPLVVAAMGLFFGAVVVGAHLRGNVAEEAEKLD